MSKRQSDLLLIASAALVILGGGGLLSIGVKDAQDLYKNLDLTIIFLGGLAVFLIGFVFRVMQRQEGWPSEDNDL